MQRLALHMHPLYITLVDVVETAELSELGDDGAAWKYEPGCWRGRESVGS